ncbi:MAG: hypothetical protein PVI79_00280 [Gammaproteobacteria bacterium]
MLFIDDAYCPATVIIGNVNISLAIDDQRAGLGKQAFAIFLALDLLDVLAIGRKYLNTVITLVGNIVFATVDEDVGGLFEGPSPDPETTGGEQPVAIQRVTVQLVTFQNGHRLPTDIESSRTFDLAGKFPQLGAFVGKDYNPPVVRPDAKRSVFAIICLEIAGGFGSRYKLETIPSHGTGGFDFFQLQDFDFLIPVVEYRYLPLVIDRKLADCQILPSRGAQSTELSQQFTIAPVEHGNPAVNPVCEIQRAAGIGSHGAKLGNPVKQWL